MLIPGCGMFASRLLHEASRKKSERRMVLRVMQKLEASSGFLLRQENYPASAAPLSA